MLPSCRSHAPFMISVTNIACGCIWFRHCLRNFASTFVRVCVRKRKQIRYASKLILIWCDLISFEISAFIISITVVITIDFYLPIWIARRFFPLPIFAFSHILLPIQPTKWTNRWSHRIRISLWCGAVCCCRCRCLLLLFFIGLILPLSPKRFPIHLNEWQ